jgi:UDP-N-acetylglucosamine 2-epimerase (non-hydrolysing)
MSAARQGGPFNCTIVVGTRPELIKCAPVVRELRARGHRVRLVFSGQHSDLMVQTSRVLGLRADCVLRQPAIDDDLPSRVANFMLEINLEFTANRPACVLVQGDTSTAAAAAWAAFLQRLPVGHIEAGLRTGIPDSPFPEEFNRRAITPAARWHFAPTERAGSCLRAEGVDPKDVYVVGNTAIDNLQWAAKKVTPSAMWRDEYGLRVLVTMHRRENQVGQISNVLSAVNDACMEFGATAILPQHPNPKVRSEIDAISAGSPALQIVPAADYMTFVALMMEADVIVSDSGGVQEEAPALSTPVLVARESTERPEAVEAGCARLIGTEYAAVRNSLAELLADKRVRQAMSPGISPFGDGQAAVRISRILESELGRLKERVGSSSSEGN